MQAWITAVALLLALLAGGVSTALGNDLAVANGDWLRVIDAETGASVRDINRYSQVMRLDYRLDGQRLAVGVCFGNKIVELETSGYGEAGTPITADGCPWDVSYSPAGTSLAATIPVRPTPLGAMTGHLRIVGANPLDRKVGYPLGALAWRPDGSHLAMVTPQGFDILGPGPAYAVLASRAATIHALAYTIDGSRLILGTATGFQVLDVTDGYDVWGTDTGGAVRHIAVSPSGTWIALVRDGTVSVRRSVDMVEVASLTPGGTLRAAEFSRDGSLLAVAETKDRVHRYQVPDWTALGALSTPGRVDAIAFRPAPSQVVARIPVLFVHGYTAGSVATWIDPGTLTSFAHALAANPQLPLDAFYLELPPPGQRLPPELRPEHLRRRHRHPGGHRGRTGQPRQQLGGDPQHAGVPQVRPGSPRGFQYGDAQQPLLPHEPHGRSPQRHHHGVGLRGPRPAQPRPRRPLRVLRQRQ